MKAALLAAAAVFGTAVSGTIHGRHAQFHAKGLLARGEESVNATGACTVYVTTITGEAVLVQPTTTTVSSTSSTTLTLTTTAVPGPTGLVTTFATPGTYTIPATTITVTEETTVCGATSTSLSSGTQTYGGVTTVVETSTTVVCPYATVSSVGSTVTSVLETTTYVCPSAGTYTIAPTTAYVSQSTVTVIPTPLSYAPGTYTQEAQTVTVVETDYVYFCPFSSSSAPAPTSAPPATSEAPAPPPAPVSSAAPPAASAPASSSAPAPSSSSSSGSASLGGSGDQWCMTYSPYTAGGDCKGAGDVAADIAAIAGKGFSSVRIYSTDCGGLESVGSAARDHGLKLVLGIFIKEDGIEASKSQLDDIVSWGQFDLVELVVVGNEAIFNNYCDASSLAGYISEVKSTLSGHGYTGPVTTTEPLNILQSVGSQLCGAIDYMGMNAHPFFNAQVTSDQAGQFVVGQIEIAGGICSGKEVVVLETGWPHSGDANGAAVPSPEDQAKAIKSIVAEAGSKCALFSFQDDKWKQPGDLGVEQFWGCADQFSG